jgi:hypothetical protein
MYFTPNKKGSKVLIQVNISNLNNEDFIPAIQFHTGIAFVYPICLWAGAKHQHPTPNK